MFGSYRREFHPATVRGETDEQSRRDRILVNLYEFIVAVRVNADSGKLPCRSRFQRI
jgi:hypothetical protein